MNLEEQLDDMAVKASEDAANLHSLQIQVDTLDEGMKCKQVKLQQFYASDCISCHMHTYTYLNMCFLVTESHLCYSKCHHFVCLIQTAFTEHIQPKMVEFVGTQ